MAKTHDAENSQKLFAELKELIEGVHGIGPSRHARGRRSGAGKSSVWPDGSDEDENSFPDFVSQSSKP